jgi:hypothetical protein
MSYVHAACLTHYSSSVCGNPKFCTPSYREYMKAQVAFSEVEN